MTKISDTTMLSDARSLRSQQALGRGLLRLMETQPFEGITIRQIVAAAGVSYPTFYRHFETKEELLAHVARDEVESFMSRSIASRELRTSGEDICAYIAGRRATWSVLLSEGAVPTMRAAFVRAARERAERGPRFNPRFPAEIMSSVVASGLFEIIAWWLHRSGDYPVGEVAAMLDWLVINPATHPAEPAPYATP